MTEIKPLIDSNKKVYTKDASIPISNKAAKNAGSFVNEIKEFISGAVKNAKTIANPTGGITMRKSTINKAGNH